MKISQNNIRIRFLKGFFFFEVPGKLFASKLPVYFDPSGHLNLMDQSGATVNYPIFSVPAHRPMIFPLFKYCSFLQRLIQSSNSSQHFRSNVRIFAFFDFEGCGRWHALNWSLKRLRLPPKCALTLTHPHPHCSNKKLSRWAVTVRH